MKKYITKLDVIIPDVKHQKKSVLKNKNPEFLLEIEEKTSSFPEKLNIRQRVKLLDLGFDNDNHPTCKICGVVHFNFDSERNPSIYCSKKCLFKDKEFTLGRLVGVDQDKRVEKMKMTNVKKYGVEYQSQRKEIQQLISENSFKKYGTLHHTQNDEVKEKIKQTNLKKYGSTSYSNSPLGIKTKMNMSDELYEIYSDPDKLYDCYINECNSSLTELGNKFGTTSNMLTNLFDRIGLIVKYNNTSSYIERTFCEKIFAMNPNVIIIKNDRKLINPYEIDILLPEQKLAIEISGTYWHNEKFVTDKYYHYNKWKMCADKGYQLLTFWDLECIDKEEQILNYIKSKMGLYDNVVYARNMLFEESDEKQYNFFDNNHIQGRANIDRNFVLKDNKGDILGCVSYAKHHRDVSKYTLNRLAFKSGVSIVGGASKLIKNSIKMIDRDVITWSDNRFSTGDLYIKCGFQFDGNVPVDYKYFDSKTKTLQSKQSNKKSVNGCPTNMTELEYCKSIGRYRLWDCGKRRFVYNK